MKAHIEIPLPYILPIELEHKIVSYYENFDKTESKAFQIEFAEDTFYVSEDKDNYEEIKNTKLKITYIFDGKNIPDEVQEILSGVLYNCLGYTNDFLSALRFTYNLNYINTLSIYDLPDFLEIEIDGEVYPYITSPMKLIQQVEKLPDVKLQLAQQTLATWEKHPEFGLVERFLSNAKHSIETEDFVSAVIELQTSFEIFIRNTLRLIIVKDGEKKSKQKEEIDKELKEIKKKQFRLLIEQNLSRKLGVKLKFENHPVAKIWYKNTYKLRNSIVHNGHYHVNNQEAAEAYDGYVKFRNYISDILVEKEYLNKDGLADLQVFKEIYSNQSNSELIHEKLKRYDFIPEGLKIKKYSTEN
ncbi:hypothetical protein C4B60_00520 [Jeotgalibacillus proteolyticus]|uniref:Uncharacterized protein n=1 Tax=Jeotgalibacillus proteolyticus TaxID=2082395 RepID=A0A2S5GG11_9BACL|nr:hypothetical protein C4B60_00520 [Jeotgalibacillus proteolyticus]